MRYDDNSGLLLVGHGTRSATGTRQFLALAGRVARHLAPLPVELAFLELQQPDIDAAVGRLIERGIGRLVTLPLLLFAAGHAKRDIPRQVSAALAHRGRSEIESVQASHLGCHRELVELSRRRMEEAFEHIGSGQLSLTAASPTADSSEGGPGSRRGLVPPAGVPGSETCLLLVGRGSHDESATADMHEFARLRQRSLDSIKVEVAFLAMARPLLSEQLGNLGCQTYRRVIVQPHLLFDGDLVESIERHVAKAAARHRAQEWMVTPPLADRVGFVTFATELIQKVIEDRCREASIRVVALGRDD
jgi:sirohydrochlorin cobaltochelatase